MNLCSRFRLLRGQLLVFKVWGFNQFFDGIAEEIQILAVVKPEAHFVQVSREMLRTHFMPRSYDAALQKAESRFHSVRVNVARSVLLRMANRLMLFLLNLGERPRIDGRFIRHNDFDKTAHVRLDDLAHGLRFRIFGPDKPQVSVALADADNDLLARPWTPAALFATYVSLIYLYCAAQLRGRDFQHRDPDSMAEKPSRAVRGFEHSLHLERGHSLLGFAQQIGRKKPLMERQVCIMEDSPCRSGELVAA